MLVKFPKNSMPHCTKDKLEYRKFPHHFVSQNSHVIQKVNCSALNNELFLIFVCADTPGEGMHISKYHTAKCCSEGSINICTNEFVSGAIVY